MCQSDLSDIGKISPFDELTIDLPKNFSTGRYKAEELPFQSNSVHQPLQPLQPIPQLFKTQTLFHSSQENAFPTITRYLRHHYPTRHLSLSPRDQPHSLPSHNKHITSHQQRTLTYHFPRNLDIRPKHIYPKCPCNPSFRDTPFEDRNDNIFSIPCTCQIL